MIDNKNLIVILGPTASGKTKLAVNVASKLNGEIISADSRQVYRGMNIGTGKDYDEYLPFFKKNAASPSEFSGVHLIDVVAAGNSYNVAFFQNDFQKAHQDIISRNKTPILCGGTGMYIEAVLRNYQNTQVPVNQEFREYLEQKSDEELKNIFREKHQITHPNADISTRKRLIRAIEIGQAKPLGGTEKFQELLKTQRFDLTLNPSPQERDLKAVSAQWSGVVFGITFPVETRRERITKRLHERLQNGMIEEVKTLLESGISPEKLIFYGLEYKFITEYLTGVLTYDEMAKRLEIAIHQFAKRQMTFFRSMECKGLIINWLDGLQSVEGMTEEVVEFVKKQN